MNKNSVIATVIALFVIAVTFRIVMTATYYILGIAAFVLILSVFALSNAIKVLADSKRKEEAK